MNCLLVIIILILMKKNNENDGIKNDLTVSSDEHIEKKDKNIFLVQKKKERASRLKVPFITFTKKRKFR